MPEQAGADQNAEGVEPTALDPTDIIGLVALLVFVAAGTLGGFFMSIGFGCLSVASLIVALLMAWDGKKDGNHVTATWVNPDEFMGGKR